MAYPRLPDDLAQQALDASTKYGDHTKAAAALNLSRSTLQARVQVARSRGFTPSGRVEDLDNVAHLRAKLRRVEADLAQAKDRALTHEVIKRKIMGLAQHADGLSTPPWLLKSNSDPDFGTPSLFVSDLHWGEVVRPSQINGTNTYNLEIAHRRMQRLAESAIRLLTILSPTREYPGIVLPFGGDFISGNIHDELTATNELNTMPTVLDLFEIGGQFIRTMADTFKRVHVVVVSGNHGRDTVKIWNKDRHHTSFDWLIGQFWAKHFAGDNRITFQIPDGPDAYFKIYNHRYLLTHGDQFRGGDGMIGALGPIIRGDHKKRSRNAQIDMEYDTLLMGHWHQYMHLTRLIVNGSLKGYDEYAYNNNFPFEKPQQALWLTHPKYGITYRMPVYVDTYRTPAKTAWVLVAG